MNHRFIPLNVMRGVPLQLAVVDASVSDEVAMMYWRTDTWGRVYRQFCLPPDEKGYVGRRNESLAERVSGLRPVSWTNSDPLDCRSANLVTVRRDTSLLAAGTVVTTLEGYEAALLRAQAARKAGETSLLVHARRASRLTRPQTKQLLAEVSSGFLKGSTLKEIQLWIGEAFAVGDVPGPTLAISQLGRVLRGESLRVPGFDYAALSATRPSPSDRASARRL